MRLRPFATLLAALAALTVFAAGCGGDDEETTSSTSSTTEETTAPSGEEGAAASTITMTEYSFDPGDPTVAQGDSLDVVNDGQIPHNLTVEGTDLATADLDGGANEDLTVDLDPGSYEFICTIADHAAQGMTGTLTVE
ncbi:MAG: plastocyanin/azurin family copper-binding protein [Solirubrobacterales bacterium]